jgi:hypothetical protein
VIANTHRGKAMGDGTAVRPVTIPNKMRRRRFPRESLGDLPGDPLGGRMIGNSQ